MACGSIANQAPAARNFVSPSSRAGCTTTIAGMAPVRMTEAPALAVASMACCALHHGGNIAATASASGRACIEIVATATVLAINRIPACNQADRPLAEEFGPDSMAGKIRG